MKLNLAQRPFSNRRPRRRTAGLLWTLAVLALVGNAFLFVQYWLGSSNGREELRAIREETDRQVAGIEALREELLGSDLTAQNEHVRFLNRKIAERTFPWSLLFDDIADVLPRNVRIDGMAPSIPVQKKKSRRVVTAATAIDWIHLDLRGTAKSSEDLLDLVDAMFESPSFTGPVLRNERDVEGEVEFDFSVRYRVTKDVLPVDADGSLELTAVEDKLESDAARLGGVFQAKKGAERDRPDTNLAGSSDRTAAGLEGGSKVTGSRIAEAEADVGGGARGSRRGAPGSAPPEGETQTRGSRKPAAGSSLGNPAGTLGASGFRPQGQVTSAGAAREGSAAQGSTGAPRGSAARRDTARTTDEIADQRFGAGNPVAPRLPNSSGSSNGGSL